MFSSNLRNFNTGPTRAREHISRRRLVEECETIRIEAVQRAFVKRALMDAVRQARPFPLPAHGGDFDVWIVDAHHRLPGRIERWSSREEGTARLYFWCLGCGDTPGHKVRNLYYFFLGPGSSGRSDLLCRKCHGLTYQSVNCGKSRWWRQIGKPLKRLQRHRDDLNFKLQRHILAFKESNPHIEAQIRVIDRQIAALRQSIEPRGRVTPQANRARRPYRDLSFITGASVANP